MEFVTNYSYDGNENLTSVTDANSNTIQYLYDEINRLIKNINAMSFETVYQYDCNNNLLSITDPNNNQTSHIYDAINRKISTSDAYGLNTSFEYDSNLNYTKIIDANGNITTFNYDGVNRKTLEVFANNSKKEFSYDGNGNLISQKDNASQITYFSYNSNNKLIKRDYPETNDDLFTYDELNRMSSATNENAIVIFKYNALNHILLESLNEKNISYSYSYETGKRTLIYPSGRIIEEQYSPRNELSLIKQNNTSVLTFEHDQASRMVKSIFGNGIITSYTYDSNDRIKSIITSPDEFININYTYDEIGNLLIEEKKHKPNNSEIYEYDKKYKLTKYKKGLLDNQTIISPINEISYSYDNLGNRIIEDNNFQITNYSSNEMNEYVNLIQDNQNIDLSSDENGNQTQIDTKTFFYKTGNKLTAILDNFNAEIKYDALGRKISEIVNNNVTSYFYSNLNLIEREYNNQTQDLIYGNKADEIILSISNSTNVYFHQNRLKSVITTSNKNGEILEIYEYEPYGIPIYYNSEYLEIDSSNNDILFTGRTYNKLTELYDYRNRVYSPKLGRFIQRDPLGMIDNFNVYEYVESNPINYTDALGLRSSRGGDLADFLLGEINPIKKIRDITVEKFIQKKFETLNFECIAKGNTKDCQRCCTTWSAIYGGYKIVTFLFEWGTVYEICTIDVKLTGGLICSSFVIWGLKNTQDLIREDLPDWARRSTDCQFKCKEHFECEKRNQKCFIPSKCR